MKLHSVLLMHDSHDHIETRWSHGSDDKDTAADMAACGWCGVGGTHEVFWHAAFGSAFDARICETGCTTGEK